MRQENDTFYEIWLYVQEKIKEKHFHSGKEKLYLFYYNYWQKMNRKNFFGCLFSLLKAIITKKR